MVINKLILRTGYGVLALLSLIGVGIVVRRTIVLLLVLINGYRPPSAPTNTSLPFGQVDDIFAQYPWLTLIHILPGLLFVVLGPFQFSKKIRRRHLIWHRRSGRVFMVSSLVIGITALVMSLFIQSIGGFNQAVATTLFAVFFLFALYQAYCHIRRRQIALHREWMIRVYAIGLSIATVRVVNVLFFVTRSWTGVTFAESFGTGFWVGFVLHLIAAEVWINRTRTTG